MRVIQHILLILFLLFSTPNRADGAVATSVAIGAGVCVGVLKAVQLAKAGVSWATAEGRAEYMSRFVEDGPIRDELVFHAKGNLKFFWRNSNVEKMVQDLPNDAESIRTQREERLELRELIRASKGKVGALPLASAQKLAALEMREQGVEQRRHEAENLDRLIYRSLYQDLYVRAGDPEHVLISMDRAPAPNSPEVKAAELRLLEIIRFGLIDDPEALSARSVASLSLLAGHGSSASVRMEAFVTLAKAGRLDNAAYVFDPAKVVEDFHDSKMEVRRFLEIFPNFPENFLDVWLNHPHGGAVRTFGPQEIATMFKGRPTKFVTRHLKAGNKEIRSGALRALENNYEPEVLLAVHQLLNQELDPRLSPNPEVLKSIIQFAKRRTGAASIALLGRMVAHGPAEISALANESILEVASGAPAKKDSPIHERRTDSHREGISFTPEGLISEIARTKDGKDAKSRITSHIILAAGGQTEYLKDLDIRQFVKDVEASEIPEAQVVSLIQRWPDEAFQKFLWSDGLLKLSPEARNSLFTEGESAVPLRMAGRGFPPWRAAAIRSLAHNYNSEVVPTLEKSVAQELSGQGPHNKEVLLALVEALADRTDKQSLDLLNRLRREATDYEVSVQAESAMLREQRSPQNTHINTGYDFREVGEQVAAIMKDLTNPDPNVQLAAAPRLRYLPITHQQNGKKTSPFAAALDSKYFTVRMAAMEALLNSNRQDIDTRNLAIRVLERGSEFTEVRELAARILSKMQHVEAREALKRVRESPEDQLRRRIKDLDNLGKTSWVARTRKSLNDLAAFARSKLPAVDLDLHTAATLVYEVPEPGIGGKGIDLYEQRNRFTRLLPQGQVLVDAGADAYSGLKYYISKSSDPNTKSATISICGSHDFTDVLTDMNQGIPQIDNPHYRQLRERAKQLLKEGYEINITGHSLGGVAAESLAYDLEIAKGSLSNPPKVRVALWNGLGATQALRRLGNFDAEVAAKVDSMNYRLTGDAVSRLAKPLGQTITLDEKSKGWLSLLHRLNPINLREVVSKHVMTTVLPELATRPMEKIPAPKPVTELAWGLPSWASSHFGFAFGAYQKARYRYYERSYLVQLQEAQLELERNKANTGTRANFEQGHFMSQIDVIRKRMQDRGDPWIDQAMTKFYTEKTKIITERVRRTQAPYYQESMGEASREE